MATTMKKDSFLTTILFLAALAVIGFGLKWLIPLYIHYVIFGV